MAFPVDAGGGAVVEGAVEACAVPFGPFVVGALSDTYGLEAAMMVIPLVCLGAVICFLLGARNLPETWQRFHPN